MKVRVKSKSTVIKKIDKAIKVLNSNIEEEVKEVTERVLTNIKANAPVDTGYLRDSFKSEYDWKGSTYTGYISSDCSYLKYVLYPTGKYNPQSTRPNGWVYKDKEGNYRFTYGTQPNPFIDKALVDESRNLRRAVRKAIQKSFK